MNKTATTNPAKTKILLAAPLIIIPFCTLFFYALGGGKGTQQEGERILPKGLNTFLPSPQIKDKSQDKLSLYQTDDKDSMQHRKQAQHSLDLFDRTADQLAETITDETGDGSEPDEEGRVAEPFSASRDRISRKLGGSRRGRTKPAADELESKLTALQQALQEDSAPQKEQEAAPNTGPDETVMKQLEAAMAAIQQEKAPAQGDPELGMMNGMLDKILDIQHPARVKERIEKSDKTTPKGMVVAPSMEANLIDQLLSAGPADISYPVSTRPAPVEGFFELSDPSQGMAGPQPSIAAVVHETKTLVTGSTLKIRLQQDVFIQNQLIPKGAFIWGRCALSGERMQISFTILRHGQVFYPVNLDAYGLDGLPGIWIPGSITRDEAKKGTNEAIQAISMSTLDPSLGAQATAAGLDAAKSLLTKKVKLVKVTINSDFPVLLRDGSAGNK